MASKKTIGKGKEKRFIVRYDIGGTEKRIQKQKTFTSSKEADEFISQVTLMKKGTSGFLNLAGSSSDHQKDESIDIPFRQYAEEWFNVVYYSRVRVSTFKTGKNYLYHHILPFFGDKLLGEISSEDINNFYADRKREGFSQKTISSIHKFLTTLFQEAVEKEKISVSPLSKIKNKPKDPIRIANPWNYSEMLQFLALAEREGKDTMYDFTLNTGLRQGEVFALPWFNVDLDKGTVTVTRSVSYDENGNPELMPKTQKSYRTLTLSSDLIEKLQEHKEKQEKWKEEYGETYQNELDLVFPNMDGGFLNPSNVRRQFYRLIKKANVRKITFHDLRHTHASLLIRNGAHPKLVMARLGHADVETTLKYYSHLWPNADKEAIQKLEMEIKRHKKHLNDLE